MNLPEIGSPERLKVLQEADIEELVALNLEELYAMSIEELNLINKRLDEEIQQTKKKLESIRAKSEKKPASATAHPKEVTKYNIGSYFTRREAQPDEKLYAQLDKDLEAQYQEKLKKYQDELENQKETVSDMKLKIWAQDTRFINLMAQYRCAIKEVRSRLEIIDIGQEMIYHRHLIQSISDRIKTPESIQKKLLKKKKPVKIDTVLYDNPLYDIAGIRVICAFKDDVYRIEELLKKQAGFTILEGDRRKDYIKKAKDNGYQSLHLVASVPVYLSDKPEETYVEIQIRTLAMDFWSSLEHDIKYKHTITNQMEVHKGLLECANKIAALDEEMMRLRDLAREKE